MRENVGNYYSFANASQREARLFFTQGCIPDSDPAAASAPAPATTAAPTTATTVESTAPAEATAATTETTKSAPAKGRRKKAANK